MAKLQSTGSAGGAESPAMLSEHFAQLQTDRFPAATPFDLLHHFVPPFEIMKIERGNDVFPHSGEAGGPFHGNFHPGRHLRREQPVELSQLWKIEA